VVVEGIDMPQITLDARVVVVDITVHQTFVRSERCFHEDEGQCGSCDDVDSTTRQPYFSRDQLRDWGVDYGGDRYWYAHELWNDPGRYRVRGIPMSKREYEEYVASSQND
jgi:hypothetical protein